MMLYVIMNGKGERMALSKNLKRRGRAARGNETELYDRYPATNEDIRVGIKFRMVRDKMNDMGLDFMEWRMKQPMMNKYLEVELDKKMEELGLEFEMKIFNLDNNLECKRIGGQFFAMIGERIVGVNKSFIGLLKELRQKRLISPDELDYWRNQNIKGE